jgi:hypothetical protein
MLHALFAACLLAQPGASLPSMKPLAGAERSAFKATSTNAEVEAFCDAMPVAAALVRRLSLGKTHQGRDIPMLVVADPPVASLDDALARAAMPDVLTVVAIGNIHAGEVDGKEALMMLTRDLAMSRDPILQRLVLVVIPNFNADGNEPFRTDNRPGQDGPEQGQGSRANAQGLDLNRDFIKLDAPETRALVDLLHRWKAHAFIDAHTTDGSFHRYIMTYAGPKHPAGDVSVITHVRDTLLPSIADRFSTANQSRGWDSFFYGNFPHELAPDRAAGADPAPHDRWETFPAEPRYATTYVGLRSRLSILTEAYSYAPFKDRVDAQRSFIRATLQQLADDAANLRTLVDRADARALACVDEPVPVRTEMIPAPDRVHIKGWVERIENGRRVPTLETVEYDVEHFDRFKGVAFVRRPLGWILAPDCPPEIIERLQWHGIRFERLDAPRDLKLSTYAIKGAKPASRVFQNRILVRIDAEPGEAAITQAPAGSILVPAAQELGHLALMMLEPASEDSLATWGFLDAFLRKDAPAFPMRRWER